MPRYIALQRGVSLALFGTALAQQDEVERAWLSEDL
jgi:hypothetical protein